MNVVFSQKKARTVLFTTVTITTTLLVIHLITQYAITSWDLHHYVVGLFERFNVDEEASIPTWYAQILLFCTASVALYIGVFLFQKKDKYRNHWIAIAVLLLCMSIDEGASMHELAIEPFQDKLDIDGGLLFFAWVIPAAVIVVVIVATFFKFWLQLPKHIRIVLAVSAVLFVAGGLGMEMLSGAFWEANAFENSYQYRVYNAAEEAGELYGVNIALYAFLLAVIEYRKKKYND